MFPKRIQHMRNLSDVGRRLALERKFYMCEHLGERDAVGATGLRVNVEIGFDAHGEAVFFESARRFRRV